MDKQPVVPGAAADAGEATPDLSQRHKVGMFATPCTPTETWRGPGPNVRAAVHAIQGRRQEMEDAHQIATSQGEELVDSETVSPAKKTLGDGEGCFFGIFDGHAGEKASQMAAAQLHQHFLSSPCYPHDVDGAFKGAFAKTEAEILLSECGAGTCVVVAFIMQKILHVAHVGDSEALLCRAGKGMPLTEPHNAKKNAKERARVVAEGGVLAAGETRVAHPKLNPRFFSIAVTRALGDSLFKDEKLLQGGCSGLSPVPEISHIPLQKDDEFLVLACDGLWDVMDYDEVTAFVKERLASNDGNTKETSEQLVAHAFDKGSTDNITCLVCTLR